LAKDKAGKGHPTEQKQALRIIHLCTFLEYSSKKKAKKKEIRFESCTFIVLG